MRTKDNITIKQKVRFGKPTIAGTRITVEDILNLLEKGYEINEITKQYPTLTQDDVKAAINYAAGIVGKEEVLIVTKNS
jgi:uncharacterized protein (DUF433 family)